MSPAEARAVLRDSFGVIAPEIDLDAIDPAGDLREEADLDSMDFLRLVALIDERHGVRIAESDYPKLASLQGFIGYLEGRLGGE